MAAFAGHPDVLSIQFENCQVMVEIGRSPTRRGVAGAAIVSEPALVRILVSMTGKTSAGCRAQIGDRTGILMTGRTCYRRVPASQREGITVVIETVTVGIDAVMACQAVIPEGLQVVISEGRIHLLMACLTDRLIELPVSRSVTVLALERRPISFLDMSCQGKTEHLVGKDETVRDSQFRINAEVIGVASLAGSLRIVPSQDSVQAGRILPFGWQFGVTDNAAVSHARPAPKGGMALLAAPADLGMRTDPTQLLPDLGVERSREEKDAAPGNGDPRHNG